MRGIKRLIAAGAAILAALSLGACASTVAVHPEYVAAGVATPVVHGKATLMMDEAARSQMFSAAPTSYTGSATTLTVPIGAVIETVGEKVCAAYFDQGAVTRRTPLEGTYVVTATPASFFYKYDQLSNLGFAITPKVTVAIRIGVVGPDGKQVVPERIVLRNDFSATGPYVMNLHPSETINRSLHMAVADIFREVLDKIPKNGD